MKRDLISLKTIDIENLKNIIDTSVRIKKSPDKHESMLKGKKMYMLFEKTSTRTALGFGLGFNELGGENFNQRWEDSNFTVGEIIDEVRYVARNVDIILARLKHHNDIEEMAKYSPVPVVNGCCDRYHPTQALADCMTIKENFDTYKKTMIYIGIWNNTFNSLVNLFPRLGGKLIGICPILNEATISEQEAKNIVNKTENLELYRNINSNEFRKLIKEADILYTDTWVDMEFINNPEFSDLKEERLKQMSPYRISSEFLKDSNLKVMHDMPIHPGYEIGRDVVEENIDTILDQGENRRHVAKGIFAYLLDVKV